MCKHDLRSFSLNLLYLIFSILTWTGLLSASPLSPR